MKMFGHQFLTTNYSGEVTGLVFIWVECHSVLSPGLVEIYQFYSGYLMSTEISDIKIRGISFCLPVPYMGLKTVQKDRHVCSKFWNFKSFSEGNDEITCRCVVVWPYASRRIDNNTYIKMFFARLGWRRLRCWTFKNRTRNHNTSLCPWLTCGNKCKFQHDCMTVIPVYYHWRRKIHQIICQLSSSFDAERRFWWRWKQVETEGK